jgi:hypothetical protein
MTSLSSDLVRGFGHSSDVLVAFPGTDRMGWHHQASAILRRGVSRSGVIETISGADAEDCSRG